MRAIDTNILVCLITRDDSDQVNAAELFVERGAWVSHLALAEATWVLSSIYNRKPADIAVAVQMLLNHQRLTIQDSDVVTAALENFRKRPAIGFSDCLLLEISRKAGHLPLGTFDRNLARLSGTERL